MSTALEGRGGLGVEEGGSTSQRHPAKYSQLGLPLCATGHVALHLGLVHPIHGEPHQRAAHDESPECVAAPRVQVKAG